MQLTGALTLNNNYPSQMRVQPQRVRFQATVTGDSLSLQKTPPVVSALPVITGKGPVPDATIRQVVALSGKAWGIPEAMFPKIIWDDTMYSSLGTSGDVDNRIRLNPDSKPEVILQTLQHELYHNFSNVVLASLPLEILSKHLKTAFLDCLRTDQFFTLPIRPAKPEEKTQTYPMPPMTAEQRNLLADVFEGWIDSSHIQGLRYTIDPRPDLVPKVKKILAEVFHGSRESLETMNTLLFDYFVFSRAILIYGEKQENLRKRLAELPPLSPAREELPLALVKDELLTGERTRAMKAAPPIIPPNGWLDLEYEDSLKENMKFHLPYMFCPEEVQARIHEESLFNSLFAACSRQPAWVKAPAWEIMTAESTASKAKVDLLSAGQNLLLTHGRGAFDTHWQELNGYRYRYSDSKSDIRHQLVLFWLSDAPTRRNIAEQAHAALKVAKKALKAVSKPPRISRFLDVVLATELKEDRLARYRSEDLEREYQFGKKQAELKKVEDTLSLYGLMQSSPVSAA